MDQTLALGGWRSSMNILGGEPFQTSVGICWVEMWSANRWVVEVHWASMVNLLLGRVQVRNGCMIQHAHELKSLWKDVFQAMRKRVRTTMTQEWSAEVSVSDKQWIMMIMSNAMWIYLNSSPFRGETGKQPTHVLWHGSGSLYWRMGHNMSQQLGSTGRYCVVPRTRLWSSHRDIPLSYFWEWCRKYTDG